MKKKEAEDRIRWRHTKCSLTAMVCVEKRQQNNGDNDDDNNVETL